MAQLRRKWGTWKYSAVPTARERMSATPSWKPGFAPFTKIPSVHLLLTSIAYILRCYSMQLEKEGISPSLRCALIGLSSTTMWTVTGAEEVGLVAVLEEVLDVPHLVVHRDEVLLVHPEPKHHLAFAFCFSSLSRYHLEVIKSLQNCQREQLVHLHWFIS